MTKSKKERMKHVPNILTVIRILTVPVILAVLMIPWDYEKRFWIAALLFVLSAATDGLDGHIARKFDAISNFGKFVDPLADKLLVISILTWITAEISANWMTVVMVMTVAREFIISGFRLVAAADGGKVIAAGWLGKIKTVTQYIALTAYLLFRGAPQQMFLYWAFFAAIILSAVFSALSCAVYIWKNREVLKEDVA